MEFCMQIAALLFLGHALINVQGGCQKDVIHTIKGFWNGTTPYKNQSDLDGVFTWLTAPSYLLENETAAVKCSQTFFDFEAETAAFVVYDEELPGPYIKTYAIFEKKPGVIGIRDNSTNTNDYLYIITIEKYILSYYRCPAGGSKDYKGFAGIAVFHVNSSEISYSEEIQEEVNVALDTLLQLGLKPLKAINTDCDFNNLKELMAFLDN